MYSFVSAFKMPFPAGFRYSEEGRMKSQVTDMVNIELMKGSGLHSVFQIGDVAGPANFPGCTMS